MYNMSQITIIGFTANDAEAHFTQNGTLVVTISVDAKESWKDADRSGQSRTDWHRIVSFGTQASSRERRPTACMSYCNEPCACAGMNATARSTACWKSALTRSASSIARNVALKLKASLKRMMPE
jgi:Single-strand binding protein family